MALEIELSGRLNHDEDSPDFLKPMPSKRLTVEAADGNLAAIHAGILALVDELDADNYLTYTKATITRSGPDGATLPVITIDQRANDMGGYRDNEWSLLFWAYFSDNREFVESYEFSDDPGIPDGVRRVWTQYAETVDVPPGLDVDAVDDIVIAAARTLGARRERVRGDQRPCPPGRLGTQVYRADEGVRVSFYGDAPVGGRPGRLQITANTQVPSDLHARDVVAVWTGAVAAQMAVGRSGHGAASL